VMSAYCIGSYDIADFVLAQCLPRRDHENPHPREKPRPDLSTIGDQKSG
jgi:hypothetical protein